MSSSETELYERMFEAAYDDLMYTEKVAFIRRAISSIGKRLRGTASKKTTSAAESATLPVPKHTPPTGAESAARHVPKHTPPTGAEDRGFRLAPLALGGTAVAGTGAGAYHLGRSKGQRETEEEWKSHRNRAFGAGLATGTTLPPMFNQAYRGLQNYI